MTTGHPWRAALVAALLVSVPVRAADDAQAEADAPPPPEGVTTETLKVVQGMSVRVAAPQGWEGRDADASFLDVSELPGAKVVLSRSWTGPRQAESQRGRSYPDSMLLVCVQAPATEWAPGLEELVFERMNQLARDELGKKSSLDSFTVGRVERLENHFRQSFQAHGELGAGHRRGEARELTPDRADRPHNHARDIGVHILTVPVIEQQVVACSLSCGETEHPEQKAFACDGAVAGFEPLGELAAEPEVTVSGRFLVGMRKHPLSVVGMGLGAAMSLVGAALLMLALVRRRSREA